MSTRFTFVFLAMVLAMGLTFAQPGLAAPSPVQINIAVKGEVGSLDATYDSFGANGIVLQNIYEFLIDKETNGKLIPGLATSWTVSPDGKTIDFTLRKGVKFHSGDPFTAEDVKFTLDRSLKVNPRMKSKLKPVERIEVVDDHHVRFHMKQPDVTFIPNRVHVMMVSKNYFDRVGEQKFERMPVGTGPYKFVDYKPAQYIEVERFEDYWGKQPQVQKARLYFVPADTTRIAKLQTGEVDLCQGIPFNMVKMVRNSPNLKAVRLDMNNPNMSIMFTTRNPNVPWYDKRVRRAMAYAINCESIIKTVLFGIPNHWTWLAPDELGYDPAMKPYPYDPVKAKQLLAEAGYPNGFDLKLTWQMGGRVPMPGEVVQAVESYLGAVGIKVQLEAKEINAYYRAHRKDGKKPTSDFVGYYGGGLPGAPDPTYGAAANFSCTGSSSLYCNPEFDKILEEAKATVSDDERAKLIKKMVDILQEEVPTITIFNNVAVYGMKNNIDFVPTKDRLDAVLVKNITVN